MTGIEMCSLTRVPCPQLGVGMLALDFHAHAEPWAWHPFLKRLLQYLRTTSS